MAAGARGSPVRNQSTIATRKIVRLGSISERAIKITRLGDRGSYSAATEESTGEVREISTRKEPEKAVMQSVHGIHDGCNFWDTYLHWPRPKSPSSRQLHLAEVQMSRCPKYVVLAVESTTPKV